MSKRSRSKANIPIHRESLFCILSPVFRLLPNTPILPTLPPIHQSILQNEPNLCNVKMTLNLCCEKYYEKTPPRRPRKNKPKQTQFPLHFQHQDEKNTPLPPSPLTSPLKPCNLSPIIPQKGPRVAISQYSNRKDRKCSQR